MCRMIFRFAGIGRFHGGRCFRRLFIRPFHYGRMIFFTIKLGLTAAACKNENRNSGSKCTQEQKPFFHFDLQLKDVEVYFTDRCILPFIVRERSVGIA